ncbi:hypothetical protein [Paraburkholderia susongensis]|uniref:hypothetical protein n=1 Tax=Paraburkholderia susongensis TaxID=1515439 RepID=UPI00142E54FA|nr:hypothetical protein [Paraburkholderia susongensis]
MLAKLFSLRAEPTPERAKPKRKYNAKRRHPAPKGARRINPDQPIIEQARGKR